MSTKIIALIGVVLLAVLLLLLFLERTETELPEEEMVDKEIEYFLSLKEGTVSSLGGDYFIMEAIDTRRFEEMSDEELMNLTIEDYDTVNIKVNVTEETVFVNETDYHFLEIPEEKEGLEAFDYIKNTPEEEYIIAVYVDLDEETYEEDIVAIYVSWSYYPR